MTTPGPAANYEFLGQTVTLPVEVRHARQASATFLVDADAAQRIIAESGLTVTRKARGKALASIALVDYLQNDLGTYHELALAFVVDDPAGVPKGPKGSVSTLIWRLPVNGEFTCAAGRGIWGFPKWVTDVSVRFTGDRVTGVLTEDGVEVVRVVLKKGRIPLPRKPLVMNAYSFLDGVLRRTPWTTDGVGKQRIRLGGATVIIGSGHPLADELRALGLPKSAIVTMFDEHMRATFGAAEII